MRDRKYVMIEQQISHHHHFWRYSQAFGTPFVYVGEGWNLAVGGFQLVYGWRLFLA